MVPPAPAVAPASVALSLTVPPTTTPVWLAAVVIVGLFLSLVFVNVQVTSPLLGTVNVTLPWPRLTVSVVPEQTILVSSQPVVAASVTL